MNISTYNTLIKPNKTLYSYDIKYKNMNKDINLRKSVINFFVDKIYKWIKKDHDFEQYRKNIKSLESSEIFELMYKIIRNYVNKNKAKWYELRTEKYYLVKFYINKNLEKYL
jgi:hypothetical protein